MDQAETLYKKLLQAQPKHFDALQLLGLIALQRRDSATAVELLRKALKLNPGHADAHSNLGNALRNLGQLDAAVSSYRRALAIRPDHADVHCNLGNAFADQGRFDEAEASYRRALALRPDHADAHSNLGKALADQGRLDEAEASYRRALALRPDHADAHSNLGNTLKDLGRPEEAVASCCRALEISPAHVAAHNNLGNALRDLGRPEDAAACYRRVLTIAPDYAAAHNNLGNALRDLGRYDDAVASFRQALALAPDNADTHSSLLFTHNYLSDQAAEILLTDARRFGALVASQAPAYADWQNVPDANRCLSVGLVSGDFSNHPVGYFLEGVMKALAADQADRIKLFAYSCRLRADALTERLKACCHAWRSAAPLSDERLAALIREDGIDVLIDLSGHTAHNRLPMFARKPAPVQASWLGYFATSGVAGIDYFIADPVTLPETEEIYFTEKIWRLPETRLCFTAPDLAVPVSLPPALTNGYVSFGCFNHLAKMNDTVVAVWSRILLAVERSRLFLKAKQLTEASVRESIVDRFAAHGIDEDRLLLEGASPRAQYLAAYNRVDIALDPFPFTGGTTTAECLWMGVPVLTLAGDRFVSRQGAGLLMNAGLSEWIAADADDYFHRAVQLSGELERLTVLRKGLRQQVLASPVFDASKFAVNFETALRGMWTQWCNRRHG